MTGPVHAPCPVRAHPAPDPGDQGGRAGRRPRPRRRRAPDHPSDEPGQPHRLVPGRRHPGERGNAVAIGHADNRTGPAVFYRLGLLRPGDTVEVLRKDRRTAVFTVDGVRVYPKKDFPDAAVYGDTEGGAAGDHLRGHVRPAHRLRVQHRRLRPSLLRPVAVAVRWRSPSGGGARGPAGLSRTWADRGCAGRRS
ncbi:sortase domain-bontaining protein [Kitasatospora aburaviensis]